MAKLLPLAINYIKRMPRLGANVQDLRRRHIWSFFVQTEICSGQSCLARNERHWKENAWFLAGGFHFFSRRITRSWPGGIRPVHRPHRRLGVQGSQEEQETGCGVRGQNNVSCTKLELAMSLESQVVSQLILFIPLPNQHCD
jgi:hypothetical protein